MKEFTTHINGVVRQEDLKIRMVPDLVIEHNGDPTALTMCYDLRFPEFSMQLRTKGAEILTFPSAFTKVTGKAHWEILLRARAIETQCYVVAAAQTGDHNGKRSSYGHSLIVSPWGDILADAGEQEGVVTAEIDLPDLYMIRKKMPVISHRRPQLYSDSSLKSKCWIPASDDKEISYPFGSIKIEGKFIFIESTYSYAFVNKKCVLKSHVLVSPKRVAKRVVNLTEEEVADLFLLVQKVQAIVENINSLASSTICIQDGKDAGQTIEHVHVHVIPRRGGDYMFNDEIYAKLQKHDVSEDIKWRSDEEMETEAKELRQHITSTSNFAAFLGTN